MPGRETPLITNEIYHVFNKSLDSKIAFPYRNDYERAQDSLFYYKHITTPIKYSRLFSLHKDDRNDLLNQLDKNHENLVDIISYCLMPTHFHLLIKQLIEGGIAKFLSNFTNSYTRYYNTKRERKGPLFIGSFKAILIKSNEQLLHVSRYIHLNPYSAGVVNSLEELKNYQYSSLAKLSTWKVESKIIIDQFKNIDKYYEFVFDNADYQKSLETIKHEIIE